MFSNRWMRSLPRTSFDSVAKASTTVRRQCSRSSQPTARNVRIGKAVGQKHSGIVGGRSLLAAIPMSGVRRLAAPFARSSLSATVERVEEEMSVEEFVRELGFEKHSSAFRGLDLRGLAALSLSTLETRGLTLQAALHLRTTLHTYLSERTESMIEASVKHLNSSTPPPSEDGWKRGRKTLIDISCVERVVHLLRHQNVPEYSKIRNQKRTAKLACGPHPRPEPFRGREIAMDKLTSGNVDHRVHVTNPRPDIVVAVASPGVGKSTLLEHFANQDEIAKSLLRWDAPQQIIQAYAQGECICLPVTFNSHADIDTKPSADQDLQGSTTELVIRLLFEYLYAGAAPLDFDDFHRICRSKDVVTQLDRVRFGSVIEWIRRDACRSLSTPHIISAQETPFSHHPALVVAIDDIDRLDSRFKRALRVPDYDPTASVEIYRGISVALATYSPSDFMCALAMTDASSAPSLDFQRETPTYVPLPLLSFSDASKRCEELIQYYTAHPPRSHVLDIAQRQRLAREGIVSTGGHPHLLACYVYRCFDTPCSGEEASEQLGHTIRHLAVGDALKNGNSLPLPLVQCALRGDLVNESVVIAGQTVAEHIRLGNIQNHVDNMGFVPVILPMQLQLSTIHSASGAQQADSVILRNLLDEYFSTSKLDESFEYAFTQWLRIHMLILPNPTHGQPQCLVDFLTRHRPTSSARTLPFPRTVSPLVSERFSDIQLPTARWPTNPLEKVEDLIELLHRRDSLIASVKPDSNIGFNLAMHFFEGNRRHLICFEWSSMQAGATGRLDKTALLEKYQQFCIHVAKFNDEATLQQQPLVQPRDAYLCFVIPSPIGRDDTAEHATDLNELFKLLPGHGLGPEHQWDTWRRFDETQWSQVPNIDLAALHAQKELLASKGRFRQAAKALRKLKRSKQGPLSTQQLEEQQKCVAQLGKEFARHRKLMNTKIPAQPDLILQNCLLVDGPLLDLLFMPSLMTPHLTRAKPSQM